MRIRWGLQAEKTRTSEKKIEIVADHFSIDSYRIFPCCAHNGYGVEDLLREIIDDLSLCVYEAE